MSYKVYKTGTKIAIGATDSHTTKKIHGKISKIEVFVSASSGFKIYTLNDAGAAFEYLLGASGATVTVAASKPIYLNVYEQKAADGSDLGTTTNPIVDGLIQIDVSDLTAADTWSVNIIYEDNY